MFSEGCGTAGSHGLTGDAAIEEDMEAANEKRAGGYICGRSEPEWGRVWEELISGGKVGAEMMQWVVTVLEFADNDDASLKESVGFVRR